MQTHVSLLSLPTPLSLSLRVFFHSLWIFVVNPRATNGKREIRVKQYSIKIIISFHRHAARKPGNNISNQNFNAENALTLLQKILMADEHHIPE